MPISAELWGVPVKFEHLWKIRSPLHQVEGFDMKHFGERFHFYSFLLLSLLISLLITYFTIR